jgi:hypothetical protein
MLAIALINRNGIYDYGISHLIKIHCSGHNIKTIKLRDPEREYIISRLFLLMNCRSIFKRVIGSASRIDQRYVHVAQVVESNARRGR